MSIDKVKKRNGSIVDFDRDRIQRAIHKAFTATHTEHPEDLVEEITDEVVHDLEITHPSAHVPAVENIQDLVEQKIASKGFFAVAKAYILYRKEHEEQRAEERHELQQRLSKRQLRVKQRDGSLVEFDITQIRKAIERYCGGELKPSEVDRTVEEALANVYDGISTTEINQAVIMSLRARIEQDPKYSYLAARVLVNDLYRDVLRVDEFETHFEETYRRGLQDSVKLGVQSERLDARMLDYNFNTLSAALDIGRDKLFTYLGMQTLYERYFVRDLEKKILETPQYFWMRVAMGLALSEDPQVRDQQAIKFYDVLSNIRYVASTPTLFHAGTSHPQMSSCYLTTVDDDLAHIFKSIGDNAQLSKWSGGLGNDWTNIRATGALIKSTNVGSQGVIPFLKISDATTAAINRSGKRRGATCVYLETWHYDIEDFLELRKNTGDERRRTHDTNTSNWIPDLFMKRVLEDGKWTLFSPNETPELHHLYGKAFEEKYMEYEKKAEAGEMHTVKQVKALDIWRKMINMLFETGHPWMTWKDPSNVRSPQDHVGVVHSSNLCTEITLNTSADETAVCNLGSINLVRHVVDGKLDKEQLQNTAETAMRMLDNVIDLNFYPTKEAENSNIKHRPVGLGIMGLQDMFYAMRIQFDSDEAVDLSDEVMEFISYYAILTSSKLAEEKGKYESYEGSKWSRNLFPIDTIELLEQERGMEVGVDRATRLDWTPVREHVKLHGMRNSNCMAIAPTATISTIAGCLPSIEPIYKNIYTKSNQTGEFTIINDELVNELKDRNLWNMELLDKIKHYDGNLESIPEIPQDIKDRYKEVFQIEPKWVIAHAAKRSKWIDQSQSLNLFIQTASGKDISDMYIAAWKAGLKTTYYLRTLGASAIEKSTVDINKKYDTPTPTTPTPVVPPKAGPVSETSGDPNLNICEDCQ
ncbi:MAG: ribonucleoside-diphosphate reductase subunit alpha [Candidatus Andersenbacteria bacterium]